MTKSKTKIEDVFLSYANNILKGRPENFYNIAETIEQNMAIDLEGIDDAIDYICAISKYPDANDFYTQYYKDPMFGTGKAKSDEGRNAVFADRYYFYKSLYDGLWREGEETSRATGRFWEKKIECEFGIMNKELFGEDLCKDDYKIKCYECHQFNFIRYLMDIISGKEYSEIKEMDELLFRSSIMSTQRTVRNVEDSKERNKFKEIITPNKIFDIGYIQYVYSADTGNSYHAFNEFIFGIASYSLTEFLLTEGRSKIKICSICGLFYVQAGLHPSKYCKTCSPKNKMSTEERREYQRKYRQQKKHERIEYELREKESEINDYMATLEITKEEAEQMWKDDQDM